MSVLDALRHPRRQYIGMIEYKFGYRVSTHIHGALFVAAGAFITVESIGGLLVRRWMCDGCCKGDEDQEGEDVHGWALGGTQCRQ
jgi:hypothetical protein